MREGATAAQSVFRAQARRATIFGPHDGTTSPSPQPHFVPAIRGLELMQAPRTVLCLQPQQVFCFLGLEGQGDPRTTVLRGFLQVVPPQVSVSGLSIGSAPANSTLAARQVRRPLHLQETQCPCRANELLGQNGRSSSA